MIEIKAPDFSVKYKLGCVARNLADAQLILVKVSTLMLRVEESNVMTMPSKAEPARKFPTLRFYGDEFVFDTVSGMFYRMNPTACFILRALDAGREIDDLPGMLQSHYDLDRSIASRDVELFLNELAALEPLNRLHPRNQARP